ncbi:MAG TPA: hypothetical protein VET89_13710 [Stellaceae bacterium]|nr:hypothetical protein [Stellaceae bacterium]
MAALAGALVLILVSACSYIPFIGKKSDQPAAPSCPVAAVLKPLANTALFAPVPDKKPINVAWYGLFSDISVSCKISGDTLSASIDNIVVAERGPAVRGNDVDFSYFIALTTADQTILGKKMFAVHVTVPDRSKRGGVTDHVEVAFNTGGRPVSDLNIMVGFQQTPEAIEFYKHYRGR